MNKNIAGLSDVASIGVFLRTGPLSPTDSIRLAKILKQHIPEIQTWCAPDGVGIQLTCTRDVDFQVLDRVRDILVSIDLSGYDKIPQLDQESLVENLMSLNYTRPLEQSALSQPELYVAGAFGSNFRTSVPGGFDALLGRIKENNGAHDIARLNPERLVSRDTGTRGYWVESKVQSGSFLRFCRPLPEAEDYPQLLGRSVVNAVVGGLGNSLITQVFRDRTQLSYNPYSVLKYMGGYQWINVDLDTSRGHEEDLIRVFRKITANEVVRAVTAQRARHAMRFMLRLQKGVGDKPDAAVRLEMTKVDGSDPLGASFAKQEDFVLDPKFLEEIAADLFNFNAMSIYAVSRLSEPDWFSNRELMKEWSD